MIVGFEGGWSICLEVIKYNAVLWCVYNNKRLDKYVRASFGTICMCI